MSPEERIRLIEHYARGPEALRAAYDLASEEMRDWRPEPYEWSIHEIICHCADAEMLAAIRIRMLATDPEPRIIGIDQDEWARTFKYPNRSVADAFALINVVRRWTTPLLTRIPDDIWTKSGHHSDSGSYTAEDWLAIYGMHLHTHVDQIEANIEAWRRRRETTAPR